MSRFQQREHKETHHSGRHWPDGSQYLMLHSLGRPFAGRQSITDG